MTWPTQRARGYSVRYGLRVEGIPVLYVEGDVLSAADGAAMQAPSLYTADPVLQIVGSTSSDADRKEGLASARPWTALLRYEGLDADMFTAPSHETELAVAVDGVVGQWDVRSVAGWPTSGN